jgi:methyltransferase (TIGR00027 family)
LRTGVGGPTVVRVGLASPPPESARHRAMIIENVSDTARWVAMYRAMETDRPDAHFRDPWARSLAGERGEQILRGMPRGRQTSWPMVVRTVLFDELILSTVRDLGVEVVVNLAAGLDTRAWRLDVPPSLRWVDVDLPGILGYKTDAMRSQAPRCRYEAIHADLTDERQRQSVLGRAVGDAERTLAVSEGLLVYLTAEQVAALAAGLGAQPAIRWWLTDLASPRLLKIMQRSWGKQLAAADAPFRFGPAEGSAFFEPHGWREAVWRGTWEESRRLRREMTAAWLWRFIARFYPRRMREEFRRFAGTLLLERI